MSFARLSLFALALVGAAGAANAQMNDQTNGQSPMQEQPIVDNGSPPARGPHKVAFTDEYGFRYDSWGNRLNRAGYVIAPPHTPRGAAVIQNGSGGRS